MRHFEGFVRMLHIFIGIYKNLLMFLFYLLIPHSASVFAFSSVCDHSGGCVWNIVYHSYCGRVVLLSPEVVEEEKEFNGSEELWENTGDAPRGNAYDGFSKGGV